MQLHFQGLTYFTSENYCSCDFTLHDCKTGSSGYVKLRRSLADNPK